MSLKEHLKIHTWQSHLLLVESLAAGIFYLGYWWYLEGDLFSCVLMVFSGVLFSVFGLKENIKQFWS